MGGSQKKIPIGAVVNHVMKLLAAFVSGDLNRVTSENERWKEYVSKTTRNN